MRPRPALPLAGPVPGGFLRPGDVRRGSPGRQRPRAPTQGRPKRVARVSRANTTVTGGAARCRTCRDRPGRLPARPDIGGQERPAVADQLPRLLAERRQSRSGCGSILPDRNPGRVGCGHRCGIRTGLLGLRPVRVPGAEPEAGFGAAHGVHPGRVCRWRLLPLSLSGRQRDPRATSGPQPDPSRRART